jgi:hypothetical protein
MRRCNIARAKCSDDLADQILALIQQSGTTLREQNAALDIVRTVVLERMYSNDGYTPI